MLGHPEKVMEVLGGHGGHGHGCLSHSSHGGLSHGSQRGNLDRVRHYGRKDFDGPGLEGYFDMMNEPPPLRACSCVSSIR